MLSTTRSGRRVWPLFTVDVSQAFLRGLTFEQAAQLKDEVRRDVQFTVPPGSWHILLQLPGFEDPQAHLQLIPTPWLPGTVVVWPEPRPIWPSQATHLVPLSGI